MQGPAWYQDGMYAEYTGPPLKLQVIPDSHKPPKPLAESQCRSFLSFTMAGREEESLHPESPFSNIDFVHAPLWVGPLPEDESALERCSSSLDPNFIPPAPI